MDQRDETDPEQEILKLRRVGPPGIGIQSPSKQWDTSILRCFLNRRPDHMRIGL